MGDIHIRPFAPGDIGSLAALITQLGYPTTPEQMRGRMAAISAHADHATFLAELDGTVVGMIGAYVSLSYDHDTPIGRVTGVVVADGMRGKGVGKRLIAAAEEWVKARGAKQMSLTSHTRRKEAHAFYRHLGYEETGIRLVRKFD